MRIVIAAIAVVTLAVPTLAETPPAAKAKPVAEKKVCRSSISTGSIMPKRVCRTAAEWAQIDGANANGVDQYRNRPAGGLGSTPGG